MKSFKKQKFLSQTARPPCPNALCREKARNGEILKSVRFGYFPQRWSESKIQRFKCSHCNKTFSNSTYSHEFRQHHPLVNSDLYFWFGSAGSLNRAALFYGVNRKTVARKFKLIGLQAEKFNRERREFLGKHFPNSLESVDFDDLESHVFTKYKPVSIPMVVAKETREILTFDVVSMPPKGITAKKAFEKYGPRNDERDEIYPKIFEKLKPLLSENVSVFTDQNPRYPAPILAAFPKANHVTCKSRRSSISGGGELKKVGFDPIFSFNHTAAMARANVNKLFRKTWNTAKRADHLKLHLEIYAKIHNTMLIHLKDSKEIKKITDFACSKMSH